MRKIFLTGLVFGMCAFLACSSRYASSRTSDGKPDEKSSKAAIVVLREYHLKENMVTDLQIREAEEYLNTLKEDRRLQLNDTPERRKLDEEIKGMEQSIKALKERTGDAGRAKAEKEFQKMLNEYRVVFERNNAGKAKLKDDPELREKLWAEFLWHSANRFKESEERQKANAKRIEFKARVVDLDGNPIPKVKVVFKTSFSPDGPRMKLIKKVGDEKGEFEVQVEGYEYIQLDRILAPKGYRYDLKQQRQSSIECQQYFVEYRRDASEKIIKVDPRFPDDGYVKFVLAQDFQRTEKIVKNQCCIGGSGERSYGAKSYGAPQNAAFAVDLFKMHMTGYEEMMLSGSKEKQPSGWEKMNYQLTKLSTQGSEMPDPKECQGKGDFVVQMFRSPADKGVGVLRITAIDGGIVKDTRGDYQAPETGYQPYFEYTFDIQKQGHQEFRVPVYLKSRNNQVCSRLEVFFGLDLRDKEFEDTGIIITIDSLISPQGDRLLTPWGPSYNTDAELRELSKRDWAKKE